MFLLLLQLGVKHLVRDAILCAYQEFIDTFSVVGGSGFYNSLIEEIESMTISFISE